jgi:hypothetical protein
LVLTLLGPLSAEEAAQDIAEGITGENVCRVMAQGVAVKYLGTPDQLVRPAEHYVVDEEESSGREGDR